MFYLKDANRLLGTDIRLGDYITEVNSKNVCRAQAESVRKILARQNSSQPCKLTIYRRHQPLESLLPSHQILTTATTAAAQTTKATHYSNVFKSILKAMLPTTKLCIQQNLGDACESRQHTAAARIGSDDTATTIDYGYYSIPSSARSCTSVGSSTSSTSSSSSSSAALSECNDVLFERECEWFREKSLEAIETYVRPSRFILPSNKFEELFVNFEKFEPMSRHLLTLIQSGGLYRNPEKVLFKDY